MTEEESKLLKEKMNAMEQELARLRQVGSALFIFGIYEFTLRILESGRSFDESTRDARNS